MARKKVILDPLVQKFIAVTKKKFSAQIILFGSRARGDNLVTSDYDFLIISHLFESMHPLDRIPALLKNWHAPLAVDLIAYTPEEYKKRSEMLTTASIIKKEGIVV